MSHLMPKQSAFCEELLAASPATVSATKPSHLRKQGSCLLSTCCSPEGREGKVIFGFNVQRAAPTKPLWAFQTFNLQDAGMSTQSENNSVLGLYVQEWRLLQKTFAEFVSKTAANLEMGGLGLLFHFLKGLEIHLLKPYTGQNSRCEKSLCSLTSQTEGRWAGHLKDLAG